MTLDYLINQQLDKCFLRALYKYVLNHFYDRTKHTVHIYN